MIKSKPIEYEIDSKGCWNCISHGTTQGYPQKSINRQMVYIYKIFYEEHKGKVPDDMEIRHTCDNKLCINPEHLIVGYHYDNMRDMHNRKRHKRKLIRDDAILIRNLSSIHDSRYLAKAFDVTERMINQILTFKRHK